MNQFKYIIVLIVITGCTNDDIFISITDPVDTTSSTHYNVDFSAEIYSTNPDTKASPEDVYPFPVGCYSNIYAYKAGESPNKNSYYKMQVYKSKTLGTLSPVSWPMQLKPGNYDIYATASTMVGSNQGPNFTNGTTSNLYNGVDYLYWRDKNVQVTNQERIIPIVYSHCCAQIIFIFSTNDDMKINDISAVNITLGKTSQNKMNLSTGNISYATSVSKNKTSMKINDTISHVITLPLQPKGKLSVDISASVTIDIVRWWWFEVDVPLPASGKFEPGKAYIYSLVFDKYEIWGFTQGDGTPEERDWITINDDGS